MPFNRSGLEAALQVEGFRKGTSKLTPEARVVYYLIVPAGLNINADARTALRRYRLLIYVWAKGNLEDAYSTIEDGLAKAYQLLKRSEYGARPLSATAAEVEEWDPVFEVIAFDIRFEYLSELVSADLDNG